MGDRGSIVLHWGSAPAERVLPFPCDSYLPEADQAYFRAVDVRTSAATLFRWLCQLKVAPYSYDWIDNAGRRSPRELIPGLEQLAPGQQVMTIFELVAFGQDRHLTLVMVKPSASRALWRGRRQLPDRAAARGLPPSREAAGALPAARPVAQHALGSALGRPDHDAQAAADAGAAGRGTDDRPLRIEDRGATAKNLYGGPLSSPLSASPEP